ncbi:hypothetical protein BDP27DRAFT_1493350 [Rhodocollybia butyracea]|uniref:Uncharacterized protein n=1 Tax=Rhodocollybia butyracea TaxID=206335 RepID=A0A9P5PE15_9AGAR|nr:hypothetical protein BDP27DRAFT_1493350 [Rhodocollybia butyracea]
MASDMVANVYIVSHDFKIVFHEFYAENLPLTILGIRDRLKQVDSRCRGLNVLYKPSSNFSMNKLVKGEANSKDFEVLNSCELAVDCLMGTVLFLVGHLTQNKPTDELDVISVQAAHPSQWGGTDISDNSIELIDVSLLPDAVKIHRNKIKAPHKVSHEVFQRIQSLIPDKLLTVLEDTEPPEDGKALKIFREEEDHFLHVASKVMGLRRIYTAEIGAREFTLAVFIFTLVEIRHLYKGYHFRFVSKEWPHNAQVLVKVADEVEPRHYNPKSDACLWRDFIPFWMMEIYSKGSNDFTRLLLSGASLVKNYSYTPGSFVLPLIYVDMSFVATIMFMFTGKDGQVLYSQENLHLSDPEQAISFLNILYNQTDYLLSNHHELSAYGQSFLDAQSKTHTSCSVSTKAPQSQKHVSASYPGAKEQDPPENDEGLGWGPSGRKRQGPQLSEPGMKKINR